jgi:hypothetical protein
VKLENIGHGGMASTQPQKMADMLSSMIKDAPDGAVRHQPLVNDKI